MSHDLDTLIRILPASIQAVMATWETEQPDKLNTLIEVVLDYGRFPEARFLDGTIAFIEKRAIGYDEIQSVVAQLGPFASDNRVGLPRTLHRISALRNRVGTIVGLTCRVGKLIIGTLEPIEDLIEIIDQQRKSLLLLGPPGVGKTSKLRELAKRLADNCGKRVLIVDTSNEIAGDGDVPHPAVGRARRLQVDTPERQKEVMIEAVQNHTPQIIVVDEIGTEEEAMAARTIAERGVALIATAHGASLENLIKNPTLSDLLGGVATVTLGDDEAKRRSTQKTVLERAKKPTFDMAIEIRDYHTIAIYPDVAEAVDSLLKGWTLFPEIRSVNPQTGEVTLYKSQASGSGEPLGEHDVPRSLQTPKPYNPMESHGAGVFPLFLYGINPTVMERLLSRLRLAHVRIVGNVHLARAIVALKEVSRPGSKIAQVAQEANIPLYSAKNNTIPHLHKVLRDVLAHDGALSQLNEDLDDLLVKEKEKEIPAEMSKQYIPPEPLDLESTEVVEALQKVHQAAIQLKEKKTDSIELEPQRSPVRRLQHELAGELGLNSLSLGEGGNRRLCLFLPA